MSNSHAQLPESKDQLQYERSMVKIHATLSQPSYSVPWSHHPSSQSIGSGFVINKNNKNYIMTNAHVVHHARYIQVELVDRRKFTAKVKHIGHDCDLALLIVDDPAFSEFCKPLALRLERPKQSEEINLLGFKDGLDFCVTNGTVSRLAFDSYVHSNVPLLTAWVDVTSAPGSSGSPVMCGGAVVGVLHQGKEATRSIMIPIQIVHHFLDEVFAPTYSTYRGFPDVPIFNQCMYNPSLRGIHGLSKSESGLLVISVPPLSDAYGILAKKDVLLEVDGIPITNDGKIQHPDGGITPIAYTHAIRMHRIGEEVTFKILRNKVPQIVKIPLSKGVLEDSLLVNECLDPIPDFFCRHGIVVQPLSASLIRDKKLTFKKEDYNHDEYGQQVLIISSVLSSDETQGYRPFETSVIYSINGVVIKNMWSAIEAFDQHAGPEHVVVDEGEYQIVLPDQSKETDEVVRELFQVPARQSERYSSLMVAKKELRHRFFSRIDENKGENKLDKDATEKTVDGIANLIMNYARPRVV